VNNLKEVLSKLKRLTDESTYEGERIAAQTAYDRLTKKFKDKEHISDWDLTNNELALLSKYDIKYISNECLEVPKEEAAMDVALNFLLKNAIKKVNRKPTLDEDEIKCLTGAKLDKK